MRHSSYRKLKFSSAENSITVEKRKYQIYTDGNTDIRVYDGDTPPLWFRHGSSTKRVPWNKGLTAETDPRVADNIQKSLKTKEAHGPYSSWNKGLTADTDERVKANIEKAQQTIKDKYGVDNIAQYLYKNPDYQVWNKGLTKETSDSMRRASENHMGCTAWNKGISTQGHPQSEETREKIRHTHTSTEFKQQRYELMKSNGTLYTNDSAAENKYYNELIEKYGADDVIRQYFDADRYPFKCDFYVLSEDLFIEVHGNWTHGGMPFDCDNPTCQKKLTEWKEKAETSKYYKNAIYTWTDLDVRKRKTAENNNLNFITIYC